MHNPTKEEQERQAIEHSRIYDPRTHKLRSLHKPIFCQEHMQTICDTISNLNKKLGTNIKTRVYFIMCRDMNYENKVCTPSKELAKELNVNIEAISRAITKLIKDILILPCDGKKYATRTYMINPNYNVKGPSSHRLKKSDEFHSLVLSNSKPAISLEENLEEKIKQLEEETKKTKEFLKNLPKIEKSLPF